MPSSRRRMAAPEVNGDTPHSAFLQHLLGYPVVNDSFTQFKSNPLGQKSIKITDSAYKTFAQPVLHYVQGPYQYVQPYVKKVDSLGDKALSALEERVPIIKKPTGEIYNDGKTMVLFPIRVGQSGKDYVFNTYSSEYKKTGGGDTNLIAAGKAMVTTALILTTEAYTTAANFLGRQKDRASDHVNDKAGN